MPGKAEAREPASEPAATCADRGPAPNAAEPRSSGEEFANGASVPRFWHRRWDKTAGRRAETRAGCLPRSPSSITQVIPIALLEACVRFDASKAWMIDPRPVPAPACAELLLLSGLLLLTCP